MPWADIILYFIVPVISAPICLGILYAVAWMIRKIRQRRRK